MLALSSNSYTCLEIQHTGLTIKDIHESPAKREGRTPVKRIGTRTLTYAIFLIRAIFLRKKQENNSLLINP